MINLKVRTEYSFRRAFGSVKNIVENCQQDSIAITDFGGTWGHVAFSQMCKKFGKKPIFGVELAVVEDAEDRSKQPTNLMTLLGRNNDGLQEIYKLVSESKFYYFPRISYADLFDLSGNVIIFSGTTPEWGLLPRSKNMYIEFGPTSGKKALQFCHDKHLRPVAVSDNLFPYPTDRKAYEVLVGRNRTERSKAMHLLDEWEFKDAVPWAPAEAIQNTYEIAEQCNATLPTATMVAFDSAKTLRDLCMDSDRVDLSNPIYSQRLDRELELIREKDFEDYFFVIADMIRYAKNHMLVGPARGSSAGSLVCYLTGITDIDPIKHDLLFERFIDISRFDMPDIDIDFPDDRREMVFEYLQKKYGAERVARLGTVSRYKGKITIGEVAKELGVPPWEVADLKENIIQRNAGDDRINDCIRDTFDLEVGKKVLEKFPQMSIASDLENHARHHGVHAAAIIVTNDPVSKYCSVGDQCAQIDKKDAVALNLLKIDALGLRTLSVIQDVLDQVGWTRDQLLDYPLNDKKAFAILNDERFAGIFQFEGYALQSIVQQMGCDSFEDISAITALARPGPLSSGGTAEYIKRQTGETEIEYLPLTEPITSVTNGVAIYQEQVMRIAREIGNLSWEDVSALRKAMSRSLGQEFFDQYWVKFKEGAEENGLPESDANRIWQHINTMGAWAFNRSHAISYAMVSYWCCVLKSQFPLEFAAACLRNLRDDEQAVRLLREVVREGLEYLPYDRQKSGVNWSVQDGKLIGGLLGIKGIGPKMAEDIVNRRQLKQPLTPRQQKLMAEGVTAYDDIFECDRRFGHIKRNPEDHQIKSKISDISDIDTDGQFVFFAKLKEKFLKEGKSQKMNKSLNLKVEDDTGQIFCTIDRFKYPKIGKPIFDAASIGDWFLIKGKMNQKFRKIYVDRVRKLDISDQ